MATYLTRQGDEWDQIAFEQLGSEYLVDQLIAANPEHQEVVVFGAGIKLKVPEIIKKPSIVGPAPWRKVTSGPTAQ